MPEIKTMYYNGHGYVTRLDKRRDGTAVVMTGVARLGGNVLGSRERRDMRTLDLRIMSFKRAGR